MGKDEWAQSISFNLAMNAFTDVAQSLFDKVPELRGLTFVGRWRDEDVLKITLDRANFQALKLGSLEDQMGQIHGRAYLEASMGKGSDASLSKATESRRAALYKKMLAGVKVKPFVSPKLK
jgi:hypothetical protein